MNTQSTNDIKVINNILPIPLLKEIETYLKNNVSYAFSETTSAQNKNLIFDKTSIHENILFGCVLYSKHHRQDMMHHQIYDALCYYLQSEISPDYELCRVHVNLMIKNVEFPADMYNPPHIDSTIEDNDSNAEYKTILFYVNDSDGDTILFNEFGSLKENNTKFKQPILKPLSIAIKNKPKANSAIVFNSYRFHSSTPPKISDYRININIVLKKL
jgi:hypothetical protein